MRKSLGFETLTVSTTAIGPASLPLDVVDQTLISVETQPVRYRDDGVDPTSAIGLELTAGEERVYDGPISKIRFIRSAASDATVRLAYYGPDEGD
jgi:hypothetical protein